jgi:hypothetical protein
MTLARETKLFPVVATLKIEEFVRISIAFKKYAWMK